MKSSIYKGVCLIISLFLLTAFGTLAQDQKQDVHDLRAKRSLLEEWTLPQSGDSRTSGSGSLQGTVRVRNIETAQPYIQTLKFYAEKCRSNLTLERLEEAADFDKGGFSSSSEGVALSVSNRKHALSATFVRLYPRHTVSITLYHPKQEERTHITITRIDLRDADEH